MTHIEDLLSQALLTPNRSVPRDVAPPAYRPSCSPRPVATSVDDSTPAADATEAAADLRALCETLVSHTPADDVDDFLTEQVPEPRSALALACILQLTDTDDGARFWWQYAAGAGQAAAAYCLYLHHLALGEDTTADWWHRQTDDVQPPPGPPAPDSDPVTSMAREWAPAFNPVTKTSTTTILRILRLLAKNTVRPRTTAVTRLMDYIPTAVTIGYLREPDMELPLPGPDFARRINKLLKAAAHRPDVSDTLPARLTNHDQDLHQIATR